MLIIQITKFISCQHQMRAVSIHFTCNAHQDYHNYLSCSSCVHLCRGADTEWKDVNSCTPFLAAAAHGSTGVVSILEAIKDKPIQADELDKNRKSAVYLAAAGPHLSLLKVATV